MSGGAPWRESCLARERSNELTERSHSILVVDDEEDFRIVLRDHFEDLGYTVAEAADGAEALEIFSSSPRRFDLVITDIRMPRLSGDELITKLREMRRYLPIIGVTGHADLSGKLAFLDNGAYYYLDKPLPHWPIVDRLVENAIRLHRYEEQVAAMRSKECEIARLLRAYIMKESSDQEPLDFAEERTIDLEIKMEYIENDRPGGDYVEWFRRSEREVVFYVADASGHDDLLSCFMTCLSSMVLHRSHHAAMPSVDEIITSIDGALSQLREADALGHERYLTFFIGSIDLVTGELAYVNAGHPEALLLRPSESGAVTSQRLESNCRPVGFLFDCAPEVGRVCLEAGDLLFIYTDGASDLLEHTTPAIPGADQLSAQVERLVDRPPQEVVDHVVDQLKERVGDGAFPDDTTLMALRIHAHRA